MDVLEPAGAVFMPAAGTTVADYKPSGMTENYYWNSESYPYDCEGKYWTVTHCPDSSDYAKNFFFFGSDGYSYLDRFVGGSRRCYGKSVRLISDE
jgi:hypothetical protein